MSITDNAGRTRSKVRLFFRVAAGLWLLSVVGWTWVSLDAWATAQQGVCAVSVDEDAGTEFVTEAEWQSWPPGVVCRSAVQWHGQAVEITELRSVPLFSAMLLALWGVTLVVLRPRSHASRAP